MLDLLHRVRALEPSPFKEIEDLTRLSKSEFLTLLRSDLNNPSHRYLLCFHRAPLFFCDPPSP